MSLTILGISILKSFESTVKLDNILNFINQYDVSTILQSIEKNEIHDYFSNLYVDSLNNYKEEEEEDYSSSTFLKDVIYDSSYKEFKKINKLLMLFINLNVFIFKINFGSRIFLHSSP